MSSIINKPDSFGYTSTSYEQFSGNDSDTTFILSKYVTNSSDIQVVVNNVIQEPGVAYSVIDLNSLVFTSAPSTGTDNIYVVYKNFIQTGLGFASNSVGSQTIAPGSIQNYHFGNISIPNSSLSNSSITINGTEIGLGDSINVSSMVYPSAGIPVSNGTSWDISKTTPSGSLVGTTDTQTLTNKIIADSNNIVYATAGPTGSQLAGFRNKIINGSFQVWQRSNTYNLTTSMVVGSADRWATRMSTSAAGIANQVLSGLSGFVYAIKLGRNIGSTLTNLIDIQTGLESVDSVLLAGKTVTLSFYAKAGTNYSSSGNSFNFNIYSGTGTDQTIQGGTNIPNAWTGATTVASGSFILTTSWTRYSITGTVGSSATQIGLLAYYFPTGTAGTDDNVYITGVQLEEGSVATPFENRTYGLELSLCYRYCQKIINPGWIQGQASRDTPTQSYHGFVLPYRVRSTPSVSVIDPGGNGLNRYGPGGEYYYAQNTASVLTISSIYDTSFSITCTISGATTYESKAILIRQNAGFLISAEL